MARQERDPSQPTLPGLEVSEPTATNVPFPREVIDTPRPSAPVESRVSEAWADLGGNVPDPAATREYNRLRNIDQQRINRVGAAAAHLAGRLPVSEHDFARMRAHEERRRREQSGDFT